MNRKKATELWPIIKAFSEGRAMQVKDNNVWKDVDDNHNCVFLPEEYEYRIKPEPKYRPFKSQEECLQEMLKHQPFGWLKSKKDGRLRCIGEVSWSDVFETVNITLATEPNTEYSCAYIFKHYIFSDGTPFGIKG